MQTKFTVQRLVQLLCDTSSHGISRSAGCLCSTADFMVIFLHLPVLSKTNRKACIVTGSFGFFNFRSNLDFSLEPGMEPSNITI